MNCSVEGVICAALNSFLVKDEWYMLIPYVVSQKQLSEFEKPFRLKEYSKVLEHLFFSVIVIYVSML